MFCLVRFLSDEDQADTHRLKAAGYTIFTKPLHKAKHIWHCECAQPAAVGGDLSPRPAAALKPSGPATLSLRRKVTAI